MLHKEEISKINVAKLKKVHFVGLLSPFSAFSASRLISQGVQVTASEFKIEDRGREKWETDGVLYKGGHDAKYITEDIDLVVYPNGPIPGNPECDRTEKLGIPAMTNGEMLGVVSRDLKTIAVAGTHGKTTTTAFIVWMMYQLMGEINFIVGDSEDKVKGIDKNWNFAPDSEYLVIEACEYKRQFLDRAPSPFISVITHIDLDHTDVYKDQQDYNNAFIDFLSNTQNTVIIDSEPRNEQDVLKGLQNVKITDVSQYRGDVYFDSFMKGNHNYENQLRAYAVGITLGHLPAKVVEAINSFKGITKRFELIGKTLKGSLVYNDYAHNPEKVRACLQGVREAHPDKELVLLFQPHSHERTSTFRGDYPDALKEADQIFMSRIYAPRRETEDERAMITSEQFAKILLDGGASLDLQQELQETVTKVKDYDSGDQVFVIASAGDLPKILPQIVHEEVSGC